MSDIKIRRGDIELGYKVIKFPAGEIGVQLDVNNIRFAQSFDTTTIRARIKSSEDLMVLVQIKDALDRWVDINLLHDFVTLDLFYVPYGRQDRVCNKGESLSIKVFCDIINSIGFAQVNIADPHSDVTSALLDNVNVMTSLDIIHKWEELKNHIVENRVLLVSPDAGSNKKVSSMAGYFTHREFIRADKKRDLATGDILETIVFADDLTGQNVLIIDDLAEGGKTFIELAKVLKAKGAKSVGLYVTHGIFSKGLTPLFDGGIDTIWTTDAYRSDLPADARLNVFNL